MKREIYQAPYNLYEQHSTHDVLVSGLSWLEEPQEKDKIYAGDDLPSVIGKILERTYELSAEGFILDYNGRLTKELEGNLEEEIYFSVK